jgi:hypothetical protein
MPDVDGHVSLEPICDGAGYILRHHPGGRGYDTDWDFAVVAERTAGKWTLRAGRGAGFSMLMFRRLQRALVATGITTVSWRRAGEAEITLSVSADSIHQVTRVG